jgi:hypothetical protein
MKTQLIKAWFNGQQQPVLNNKDGSITVLYTDEALAQMEREKLMHGKVITNTVIDAEQEWQDE